MCTELSGRIKKNNLVNICFSWGFAVCEPEIPVFLEMTAHDTSRLRVFAQQKLSLGRRIISFGRTI